ncbi:hypothetical protein [Natronosalvus amylolyticus]|uniref:hypothetical protein n=1 Tax=Natronosalvus amylolyticus TaxID=2961994 RepID=UPI0020C947B6|nr:hypothetical protein [Natronosalvus amylolyticus]
MTGEYEYVAHRPEYFGETTFDTRHEAVGHAAILSRYVDDDFEVFARRKTREPMVNDALWRARIIDKTSDEWEHIGYTLLYEARSSATESAYRYMLANHLDEVSVSSNPWYGDEYVQVGALEDSTGDGSEYPIYLGFSDGEPLEHDANSLQYASHFSNTSLRKFDQNGDRR